MSTIQLQPPAIAQLTCHERTFATWDGAELFYRAWLPAGRVTRALVLFHRGHEHSGRFDEFARQVATEDMAVFAWDARGHGRSPGERGYADSFSVVIRDMDCFVRFLSREHELAMQEMIVLGHSVGAVAVAAWVHDYAPTIRAMVLVSPALRVKLYVPFALPALRLRNKLGGKAFIKSYVKAQMLTRDAKEAESYRNDALISRQIAVNILIDLHDLSTRLLKDAGAIVTPTLMLAAGRDWVVKNSAQRRFFERLSSKVKEMETYGEFYHAILHEKDRQQAFGRIRRFIAEAFERPVDAGSMLTADKTGYTRREYERLSRPLSWLSPKRWNFALQRLGMRSICRTSRGVQIGWRSGFDSGESLDYVYQDKAHGITPLGRLIDRIYLNAVGWRGIRQRRTHLREALQSAIDEISASGRRVRMLDIAAGPGRYMLDAMKANSGIAIEAVLRDRSAGALDAGRQLAAAMQIANVRFEEGDAFSEESLGAISPPVDIAVVSGLYELFPENEPVRRSLRGLAKAVRGGGFLIYTNQPWHPQVEMIARVLTNRDGRPWVMRRRTQHEMDQLVREAGFEKMGMRIDADGIFTVSVARRA